jgi:cytochrome c-type biogenesis protein
MDISPVSFVLVFGAGILSILSPCVLPMMPAYLGFLTGMTPGELTQTDKRKHIMRHSVAFLLGFSLVFIALGALANVISSLLTEYSQWVRYVGGVLLLVIGLSSLGWVKIPFLKMEARAHFSQKPVGYLGSALVGLAFAAGWSPCMGPMLALALTAATENPGAGIPLLMLYVLGFSIPFLLFAFFFGSSRKLNQYTPIIEKIGGYLMLITAFLLFTNGFAQISNFLSKYTGFTAIDELFIPQPK